jgi:anti-sigma factor RsiW
VSCADYETLIALYVENDLTEQEMSRVESHVETCAACSEFVAAMRESQAVLKALRLDRVDDADLAEIRASVMSEVSSRRKPIAWPKLAIAAALVVTCAVAWMWRMRPDVAVVVPSRAAVTVPPAPMTLVHTPLRTKHHPVRAARHARSAPVFKSEPLVVKMFTDDPQVVIYWLVDQNGG